jgi:hypothetical protein
MVFDISLKSCPASVALPRFGIKRYKWANIKDKLEHDIFRSAFARLRKANVTFIMFVLSVRPSTRNNSAPTGRIFMKLYILLFCGKESKQFKFRQNLTRITVTLREDQYKYLFRSRSALLRIRNVSDKRCRENQTTRFVFSNFSSKIVPFMK